MTNRGRLIIKPSLKRPSAGGFSKGRETEEDRKKESAEAKEAKRIDREVRGGRKRRDREASERLSLDARGSVATGSQ